MNIYLHELKMNTRSIITWSATLAVLLLVFLSMFSVISVDMASFNKLMENYPPEMMAVFGLSGLDMGSILGFFALAFLFCQLCVSIQAANLGVSLVSIEERDLTADFLLAKPVSRVRILTAKLLAALTGLAISNAVVWICSLVFVNLFKGDNTYNANTLSLLLLTVTFLQLFFLMVGLLISLLMKKVRSVLPISMGLVFALYILSAFGSSFGEDIFSYLTPFKYFEANAIIKTGALNMQLVPISLVVTLLAVVGSYWLYQRRDIHSV